jgi:hypothetical protein
MESPLCRLRMRSRDEEVEVFGAIVLGNLLEKCESVVECWGC